MRESHERGVHEGIDLAEGGARAGEQLLPGRGEQHAPAVALEQLRAEQVLELLDLQRERGLRDEAGFSGAAEGQVLGHGDGAGVGGESDMAASTGKALARELPQIELATGGHEPDVRSAEVQVVPEWLPLGDRDVGAQIARRRERPERERVEDLDRPRSPVVREAEQLAIILAAAGAGLAVGAHQHE